MAKKLFFLVRFVKDKTADLFFQVINLIQTGQSDGEVDEMLFERKGELFCMDRHAVSLESQSLSLF